mgnify:FL=1
MATSGTWQHHAPTAGPEYRKVFGPAILVLSGMQLLMVLDGTVAALALSLIHI